MALAAPDPFSVGSGPVAGTPAVDAARLALQGDGEHTVSTDRADRTVPGTGKDRKTKDKETSRGGSAVNVVEC